MMEEINTKSRDIWISKMKITKMSKKLDDLLIINYNLNSFEINKIYISAMLKILWNYPEAVYHILRNTENSKIENNLANFFVNNFFTNFMSGNSLENNLLFVITMMLKEEIDQIKDIYDIDNIFKDSKVMLLLKEMINFPDIQLYFNKIIFKTIEKMENNFSWKKMDFNMSHFCLDLKNYIKEQQKSNKKENKTVEELCKKYIKIKLIEQSMNSQDNEIYIENKKKKTKGIDLDEHFLKYTGKIQKIHLDNLAKEAEKYNKIELKKFFLYLSDNIIKQKNSELYSNKFLEGFVGDKLINFNYLLYIYQHDFLNLISLLDLFLEDLLTNVILIPDSIKYICKIISLLLKNKFHDVPQHIECAILSKFFFDNLLAPMLKSPNYSAFINDVIISDYTEYNMKYFIYVLQKIFSSSLFQINSILPDGECEQYFTLFNRYIIGNIEKSFFFYEKTINIQLPSFIEQYINNSLPSDYLYDYFIENPEEISVNISICFNIDNLFCLIDSFKICENEIFSKENTKNTKLKRLLSKFKSKEKIIELKTLDNKLKNQENFDSNFSENNNKGCSKSNQKNENIINYYIITEIEIEKNYENIFKIDETNGFHIDIKKLEKNGKLEEKEKNLIKFKNYLINSLKNYKLLKISSFKSTESVYTILSEIKNYMYLPHLYDEKITLNWSISSVLTYMQKIPEEYKENDYEKCFEELTKDLQESIDQLDFEKLFIFEKYIEQIQKVKEFYAHKLVTLEDIKNSAEIKKFIEEFFFPIEFKFSYEDEDKIFKIKKSNIHKKALKDNEMLEFSKKEIIIFKTISSFIKYFPDLNIYQEISGINPFEIIEELKINKILLDYFDLIKYKFIEANNCTEEIYDEVYDLKIKNYIMNKIYKKIYPKEVEYQDSKLFEKTMHLSWVEPNMIIKGDTSLDALDNLLPDILAEFKRLNLATSPFVKFLCIKKIFELIGVIVKFNDGGEGGNKEIGAEDLTPYLNYVLIRACPVNIFTDIKFIKFFLKNEGKLEYDFLNVEIMCKNIMESTYKNYNISEEEYIKKCNECINDAKNNNDKRFNEIIERLEVVSSNN